MSIKSIGVITDDTLLHVEIGAAVERHFGCLADRIPADQWRERCNSNQYRFLLLDLRDNRLWPQLHSLGNCGGPPRIGIVASLCPVEWIRLGAEKLDGMLSWPHTNEQLYQVLDRIPQSNGVQSHDAREIGVGSVTFRTMEPDLFPLIDQIQLVADRDFSVLLVGETGTGKTTLSRLIHNLSARRSRPFVNVACGALPNELMDSELFGHVKGAFTGALDNKIGRFAAAGDGTLLLDEIDVLRLPQQAKLLRVLETGEFEQVGSNTTQRSMARTIVASNLCLETLIAKEQFRADLFFRLNQVKLEIPALRERPRDIIPLAFSFLEEASRESGHVVDEIHPDVLHILQNYCWPGNIRELRNEVRRAVLFNRDGRLTPKELSPGLLRRIGESGPASRSSGVPPFGMPGAATTTRMANHRAPKKAQLSDEVAHTEQEAIEQMLRTQNFNRTATARALGISRVTLYNKIRKYHINADRPGDNS